MSEFERFISFVEVSDDGCWNWKRKLNWAGYGRFYTDAKIVELAHRYSYRVHHKDFTPKKLIHHKCENRACVNPKHLQQLTLHEHIKISPNMTQTRKSLQTHCIHGHEFNKENTYLAHRKDGRIERQCRPCTYARLRRYAEEKITTTIRSKPCHFQRMIQIQPGTPDAKAA